MILNNVYLGCCTACCGKKAAKITSMEIIKSIEIPRYVETADVIG